MGKAGSARRVQREASLPKARPLSKAERDAQMHRDGYLCRECGMDVAWAAMHIRSTIEAARATAAWKGAAYSDKPQLVASLAEVPKSYTIALMRKSHEVPAEVDHIVPRALGGTNDPDNLQTLCAECHKGKSAADVGAMARLPSSRKAAQAK